MAKTSKATRKFNTKHLKKSLDHRKEVKKHSQLLARHKKGKSTDNSYIRGDKPKNDLTEKVRKEKENPFDVETDSEDEAEDYGVIDKKGKNTVDKEEEDVDEEDSDDDDIFKDLDDMAEPKIDEDYGSFEEFEDEEEVEESEKSKKPKNEETDEGKIEITLELVKSWEHKLKNKASMKIFKQVIQAFKAAVNTGAQSSTDDNTGMTTEYKYFITRDNVFNKLLFLTLKKLPIAVQQFCPFKLKFNKELNIQVRTVKKDNSQLSALLKQHAFTLITLLSDITRSNLNLKFILLTLSSIYDIFPYLVSHRTLLKKLVNCMTGLWSSLILTNANNDEDDDEKNVNIDSFLDTNVLTFSVILNLSKEYSSTILETVINSSYEAFLKRSLSLSSTISLDSANTDLINYKKFKLIEFLKSGLISLFEIDLNLSYQIAFKYIRKLSIYLRNFLKNNSNIKTENENSKNLHLIYNWQFIQSIDFWVKFLADACNVANKANSLKELIFPIVQISVGTIKLNNSLNYFPIKFYLFKSLIELSKSANVYIPLLNNYIEILNSSIFNKNFTTKSDKKISGNVVENSNYIISTFGIKVSKNQVNTTQYQSYLINNYLHSLREYLAIYGNSLSFPELSFLLSRKLKSFNKKQSAIHKKNKTMLYFIKELQLLNNKIQENTNFIMTYRNTLTIFDPLKETTIKNSDKIPLFKYLKIKTEIFQENNKVFNNLLINEQINEDSGSNDRKISQNNSGEDYFKDVKVGKKKSKKFESEEDVEMSDDSSTTGSI